MAEEKSQFTGSKKYLEKSFLEELNYKIWTTKGARFEADKRLKIKANMSHISLATLSAYLIIASLISVYNLNQEDSSENLIGYVVTALSILVLVVTQYESSRDYKLRAKMHHDCGLALSDLYDELRIFKTLKNKPTDFEILHFTKDISKRYQDTLKRYDNHSPIDYDTFQISKLNYFEELTEKGIKRIKRKYKWEIYGWYSIMIVLPPVLIITYLVIDYFI